jgi:glycosyltransferase involved in cell wall biosynthesis
MPHTMMPVRDTPRVSVVVPTIGRPELLRVALQSVVDQTLGDWEAVVVDNAGPPETAAVAASFADERIVVHRKETRAGMVESWGTGVRLARGDYVVVLADDDSLGRTFLETRVARLDADPALLVAFSRFEVRRPDGSLARIGGGDAAAEEVLDGDGLLHAAVSGRWFIGASLYRRDPVVDVWPRLRDDDLVLDLGLNVRLSQRPGACGVALPEADFTMLSHAAQNTEALRDDVWRQTAAALSRLAQEDHGRRRRLLRDARATWTTSWARHVAATGDLATARRLLVRAVRASPRKSWPWRQLALAYVRPDRLR